MENFMQHGIDRAIKTSTSGVGGPFGATIVKGGKVIAVGSNQVLQDNDPTQHAEMVAIREACKVLGTYDLTGCILYTTCEPCPMCLSATIWSNIKDVHFGCTKEDAANIGFRDDFIYEYIKGNQKDVLNMIPEGRTECIKLFEEYSKNQNTIY